MNMYSIENEREFKLTASFRRVKKCYRLKLKFLHLSKKRKNKYTYLYQRYKSKWRIAKGQIIKKQLRIISAWDHVSIG